MQFEVWHISERGERCLASFGTREDAEADERARRRREEARRYSTGQPPRVDPDSFDEFETREAAALPQPVRETI